MINNLIVKSWRSSPIPLGMSDRNEDELNPLARKTLPELMDAAYHGTVDAYADVARPTANITLPSISEHTIGQLMQMLMLATVIEGRLLGINPYGQPGVEAYKRNMRNHLRK
jgi:glucose-6-phosphate isomerase